VQITKKSLTPGPLQRGDKKNEFKVLSFGEDLGEAVFFFLILTPHDVAAAA
jgi:hypothetical protein